METPTPTLRMIGDASMNRPFRDELHKALVACLEQPVAAPPRTSTSDRNAQRKALTILWLVFVVLWVFTLASLYSAWYGFGPNDWWWFWWTAGLVLVLGVLLFISALYTLWRIHHPATKTDVDTPLLNVRALRTAVLSADDTLAPSVMNTTAPNAPGTLTTETGAPRVLPALRKSLVTTAAMQVIYTFVAGLWVVMQVVEPLAWGRMGEPSWQALLFFPLMLALAIWGSIAAIGATRPFRVRADADGLRWRQGWRRKFLRWQDVRGWCVFLLAPEGPHNLSSALSWPDSIRSQPLSAIYALIGEGASLTWLYRPRSRRTAQASQALAQLIQAHSGLPLRDLSSASTRLLDQIQQSRSRVRQMALAAKDVDAESNTQPALLSATLIFLLSVLVVLAGILTPFAQQQYYGAQIQQLEAAYPQIRDPLTSNTLGWTPAPPDQAKTFTFTTNGYASERACCNVTSRVPGTMRDGLLEVTVRPQTAYDFFSAGLLFRADTSAHTALVFAIKPNQEWQLLQFTIGDDGTLTNERELRSDGLFISKVGAIHTGEDASNRLAVLMDGSSCAFFINGQYVGSYLASDLPHAGEVGIYVESSGGLETFSDLLISPPPVNA